MANLLEQVGVRVRRLRKDAGLTQDIVAGMAELHKTYVSDIERGKAPNVSLAALGRIAGVLEVSVAEIVDVSGYLDGMGEEKMVEFQSTLRQLKKDKQEFILDTMIRLANTFLKQQNT